MGPELSQNGIFVGQIQSSDLWILEPGSNFWLLFMIYKQYLNIKRMSCDFPHNLLAILERQCILVYPTTIKGLCHLVKLAYIILDYQPGYSFHLCCLPTIQAFSAKMVNRSSSTFRSCNLAQSLIRRSLSNENGRKRISRRPRTRDTATNERPAANSFLPRSTTALGNVRCRCGSVSS